MKLLNLLAGAVVGLLALGALAHQPPPKTAEAAQPGAKAEQRWKGTIELPGMKLDFGVALTPSTDGNAAAGTMDIPMQGLKSAPLSDVSVSGEELKFSLALPSMPANAHAHFSAKLAADGKTAEGELKQGGITAPVRMERIAEGADATIGPRRPQDPKPPFPYTQREVSYTNAKDGTKLAATVTLPPGPGPHPAAVLITGSGAQDRDESILGHRPFLVIADHLTRAGIAVLRADDRGVGGSGGSVTEATAADSTGDVLAAIALLKTMPEIDAAKIGVIGHSEGGIIGPMAAATSKDVAFVVMLAGTGLKGRDILTMQSEAIMLAAGIDKAAVKPVVEKHRALMDSVEKNAPAEEIERAVGELMKAQTSLGGHSAPALSDEQVKAGAKQQMETLNSKWFRSFLFSDPREALRKVTAPVLALNGSLDTQVPAGANLPEIEKALKEAGNTDVTVRELPGLNHLFQAARTGSPDEYVQIDETFNPEALKAMTEWVLSRTTKK